MNEELTRLKNQYASLLSRLQRLLEYPLHLVVRRSDVRAAANEAGIPEPSWPTEEPNLQPLLDQELKRQLFVANQLCKTLDEENIRLKIENAELRKQAK